MANKELNRLKVVLAEKRKRTNGLVNNWERIKQPYQNGVLILEIKNPPLPPQQHQLKILHTNKYIQNDRQKDPGLPLGWA